MQVVEDFGRTDGSLILPARMMRNYIKCLLESFEVYRLFATNSTLPPVGESARTAGGRRVAPLFWQCEGHIRIAIFIRLSQLVAGGSDDDVLTTIDLICRRRRAANPWQFG